MSDVFVVSAVRTPIGRFGGALKDHTPVDLAAVVMKEALTRAGVEGAALDFYTFGNVLRAGQGQLVPRQAAFKAGIPKDVDGCAIDMVCSSGMMAFVNAATMIKAGEADLVMAGGTESMSGTGFYLSGGARWGYKYLAVPGQEPLVDVMQRDGLSDPFTGEAMGNQADRTAAEHGASREDIDAVAAESHRRAAAAHENGHFSGEIVGVEYRDRKETKTLLVDEGIRAGTTAESLAGLRPAFGKEGRSPTVLPPCCSPRRPPSSGMASRPSRACSAARGARANPGAFPRRPSRRRRSSWTGSGAAPTASTCSKTTKPSRSTTCSSPACSASASTRSTCMAGPSRSATPSGPPARASS
jgi:acetyl-CoA acetyltransferase family protein